MARDYRRKTDSLPTCMNCGSVLYGIFCSHCGQRSTEAITFKTLWLGFWERLSTLDFRWFRTLADLTLDPGRTIRRYLKGRRLPYVGPIPFALGMALFLSLVAWITRFDLSSAATPWGPIGGGDASYAVFAWAAFAAPIASLLVAWLQRSLFREYRFSVAETWIFDLFVFGQVALYQVLFGLVGGYASPVGLVALALVMFLVLAFALGGFYRIRARRALPAALLLTAAQLGGVWVASAAARLLCYFPMP